MDRSADFLRALAVAPDATVREAMAVIDRGAVELAFVTDPETQRVTGVVTDGDLRRAILGGAALDDRVLTSCMSATFVWVPAETGRAEVLDLMKARFVDQIPVLDDAGRLIALHTLREFVGRSALPNAAVIMAGGLGRRLHPLTENVPKPMLKVAGRPILERIVLHLVGCGISTIYLAVHYLSEVIRDHFGDGAEYGCEIRYLEEREPLGTAGALSLMPERPERALLVMNGDLITQEDVGAILDTHARAANDMTCCLTSYSVQVPFGVASVSGDRVIGLEEKPSRRFLVNAGMYAISPSALSLVPSEERMDMSELITSCLERDLRVGFHPLGGDWLDVGRPDQLDRARGMDRPR